MNEPETTISERRQSPESIGPFRVRVRSGNYYIIESTENRIVAAHIWNGAAGVPLSLGGEIAELVCAKLNEYKAKIRHKKTAGRESTNNQKAKSIQS